MTKQNEQTDLIKEQARCISHEIRNHVSVCDVYTEIIRRHLVNAHIENSSIDSALNCISKSLKMISNSLFDLKSLDNFKLQKLDLREILFQAIELSKVYVQDKKIKFIFEAEDNCEVNIDENKFLACIINLVKNAIESIEFEGYIKISLSCSDKFALVKIANNGAMISNEKQKQIFDEGFTTKKTGSGLGLYICKNNLTAQNSDLRLIQSSSELTVFEIKIPKA